MFGLTSLALCLVGTAAPPVPGSKPNLVEFDQNAAFVENRGQWNTRARFLSQMPGVDVWVADDGIVLDYYRYTYPNGDDTPQGFASAVRHGHAVRVSLVGSTGGQVLGAGKTPGVNHYVGRGAGPAANYGEAWIKGGLTGVDLRYYSDKGAPRYDVVVRPGVNPSSVRLRYDGAKNVRVNSRGDLQYDTALGTFEERGLYAYQKTSSGPREVKASPVVGPDGSVSYRVGSYDKSKPLIIDPRTHGIHQLNGANSVRGVAASSDAYFYTGYTTEPDFPTTAGAYQTTHPGGTVAFVRKVDLNRNLVWSTYLGDQSFGMAISVDNEGRPVVAGSTYDDFPVTNGASDTLYAGLLDGFVARLDPTGSWIDYATYVGGTKDDEILAMQLDASGNAIVGGYCGAMPTTAGAYDRTFGGGLTDGFVSRISLDGVTPGFTTFLGGTKNDRVTSLTLDAASKPVVGGVTSSVDFPFTSGAVRKALGGVTDGFASRLSDNGTTLEASSFIGGSGYDAVKDVAIDNIGRPILVGETNSTNFPTSGTSFQPSSAGGYDGFVLKLDPTTFGLSAGTYIGGSQADAIGSVLVAPTGQVFLFGQTTSPNYPKSPRGVGYTGGVQQVLGIMPGNLTTFTYNSTVTGSSYSCFVNGAVLTPDGRAFYSIDFKEQSGFTGGAAIWTTLKPAVYGYSFNPEPMVGNPGRDLTANIEFDMPAVSKFTYPISNVQGPVQLPTSFDLNPGSWTASFPIDTEAVFVETPFTFAYSDEAYGYSTGSTLLPPVIDSIQFKRVTVMGGKLAYGTVNFPAPVPSDGQVVPLKLVVPDTDTELDPSVATIEALPNAQPYATSRAFAVTTKSTSTVKTFQVVGPGGVRSNTVTINRPEVQMVTVASNPVGGTSVTGTVTLAVPAPPEGLVVDLISYDDPLTDHPAQVTVAAGTRKKNFTITTVAPAVDTWAPIFARRSPDGMVTGGWYIVQGPKPASLVIANGGAKAGMSTNVRVKLNIPAPAGGITVSLASMSANVTVPSTVFVPEGGAYSNIFTATVAAGSPVGSSYTINATYNGATATGTVKVLP